MIASTGGGFAVLEWWVYLVMAVIVAVVTWAMSHVVAWEDRRAERADGPQRCAGLVHRYDMGRPAYIWCHMPRGHSGPHRDEYGSSEEEYRLPQRESRSDPDTMSLFLDRIERQANEGH